MLSPSIVHNSHLLFSTRSMEKANSLAWLEELKMPETLRSEAVRSLHATIEHKWDPIHRTACQTAAGRALWNHVVRDPVAGVLAGESFLRSLHEKMRKDWLNNAREVSGVILAVRTLWFDSRLEAAIDLFETISDGGAQVVLLGAGMDARAYRLGCLKECTVFEVDFPELLEVKAALIQEAMGSSEHQKKSMTAKSLVRVAADIRDCDWLDKLQRCGFIPKKKTVWMLEGILYYLPHTKAMQVLQSIAAHCALTQTVLLADFMNKSSVSLSHSTFHFYSDWPDQLLPTLGFSHAKLSQIGDPDAHFGLLHDPQNLFDKLRKLPRSIQIHPEDGTPCRRLYLVEASNCHGQVISRAGALSRSAGPALPALQAGTHPEAAPRVPKDARIRLYPDPEVETRITLPKRGSSPQREHQRQPRSKRPPSGPDGGPQNHRRYSGKRGDAKLEP